MLLETTELESLTDYDGHASRLIYYFCKKWFAGNPGCWDILDNDEVHGRVVEALIEADLKWDAEKGKSKRSFRFFGAKICLLKYVKDYYRFYDKNLPLYDNNFKLVVEDEELPEYEETINFVQFMLTNTPLKPKDREYISKHYLERQTLAAIGKEFECSAQNVQQGIQRGLNVIRKCFRDRARG